MIMSKALHHVEDWTCDCLGCELVRAGVCIDCARAVALQVGQMNEEPKYTNGTTSISVDPCSGSCREAFEHFSAAVVENQRLRQARKGAQR
jgi:hypothetical protein